MDKYNNYYNYDSSLVNGNSLDMDITYGECEIIADIVMHEYKSTRLWGRIITCDGEPVANALIKLLKVIYCDDHNTYKGVAHTVSDCEGFYQFELPYEDEEESCYKILVSKVYYENETCIPINNNSCDCDDSCSHMDSCDKPYRDQYNKNYNNSHLDNNLDDNDDYDKYDKYYDSYQPTNNFNDYNRQYEDSDHIIIHNKPDKYYANTQNGCKCREGFPPSNKK